MFKRVKYLITCTGDIMNNGLVSLIILLIISFLTYMPETISNDKVYVVVSFPNLVEDLKTMLCPNDQIEYIAPPGIDPHEYSLSPEDINKLKKADVIISTGHAPFEIRIRELSEEGIIKGILIEIPKVPGIVIKKNPVLGTLNYHMPIYDPDNYIIFINYVANVFSEINKVCSNYYIEKAREIGDIVESIKKRIPNINLTAVADTPVIQYAVEWIGIHIDYLVIREHGIETTPSDLELIEKALSEDLVDLVIITYPVKSRYSQWLLRQAQTYNKPILYVLSPLINQPIYVKLENITKQLTSIINIVSHNRLTMYSEPEAVREKDFLSITSYVLGIILYSLLVYVLMRRSS